METIEDADGRCQVNKELLPLKVFYFLMYGACMVIPYVAVFLKYLDLTASEVGLITGASVLVCLFTRPSIGMMADKLRKRKMALVLCCLAFGSCFFLLNFVPRRISNTLQLSMTLGDGRDIWICDYNSTSNGTEDASSSIMDCHFDTCDEITFSLEGEEEERGAADRESIQAYSCPFTQGDSRGCLSLRTKNNSTKSIIIIKTNHISFTNHSQKLLVSHKTNSKAFASNSTPRSDISIHECLTHCSRLSESQWTTSEFGSSAVVHRLPASSPKDGGSRGPLLHHIHPDSVFMLAMVITMFARVFYSSTTSLSDAVAYSLLGSNPHRWARQRLWGSLGIGLSIIATTAVSTGIHGSKDLSTMCYVSLILTCLAAFVAIFKLDVKSDKKSSSLTHDLRTVLASSPFRLLLCKLVFFGFMTGTAQNFFMWFIADIGGSRLNLAMTVIMHCTSSIVLLWVTGRLLKRIGPLCAIYLVSAAYVVRFFSVSFLRSPWAALPLELLHGVTYSIFWAATSGSISQVAPHGTQATCQGIAGAVYWDLGRGLGTMTTGQLIQVIGARWTFRAYAGACAVALPLLYALDRLWPMPSQHTHKTTNKKIDNRELKQPSSSADKDCESVTSKILQIEEVTPEGSCSNPLRPDIKAQAQTTVVESTEVR